MLYCQNLQTLDSISIKVLSTGGDSASTMVNSSAIDYDCRIVGYQCRGRRLLLSRLRIYRLKLEFHFQCRKQGSWRICMNLMNSTVKS